MNKGYVIEESPSIVEERVKKILETADGASFNACFNSARGTLNGGIYAQFSWMAKNDGNTVLTLEARSASDIDTVYEMLFSEDPEKE